MQCVLTFIAPGARDAGTSDIPIIIPPDGSLSGLCESGNYLSSSLGGSPEIKRKVELLVAKIPATSTPPPCRHPVRRLGRVVVCYPVYMNKEEIRPFALTGKQEAFADT